MSGRCPRCGGERRRALAPGYFECESEVVEAVLPQGTPTPALGRCGHRYQVGARVAEACACGMFAVGACQICGALLCGEHGTRDGEGRFVCVRHVREAAEHEAARRADEQRAEAADRSGRVREQARQAAAALKRSGEPPLPAGVIVHRKKRVLGDEQWVRERYELERPVGNGWEIVSTHISSGEGDGRMLSIVLLDDGRLFYGRGHGVAREALVRVGRRPRRTTMLSVGGEVDLDDGDALRALESKLPEISG